MHVKAAIAGLAVLVTAVVSPSRAALAGDDPSEEEGEELAESIVLTLDDMPAGWESTPADDDEDEDIQADLADCLGVDDDELDGDNPKAVSPDFSSPNDEEVSATVTVTPSAEDASRRLEILEGEDALPCYAEAFTDALEKEMATTDAPDDLEFGDVTFDPLDFPELGDGSVAYRVTVPFSTQGISVDLYLDLVAVQVGEVGISAQYMSPLTPFDTDEAARLTEIMVDRASA